MHWLGSLRNRLLFTEEKPELKHFDLVSESQATLTEICSAWL